MKFTIQEPIRELTDGLFMLIMKYGVIVLCAWMIGILVVCTYPCFAWNGEKYPPTLMFLNDYYVVHLLVTFIAIYFFTKYQFKKYNNGILTEIEFNQEEITLTKINTLLGKKAIYTIKVSDFKILEEEKNGKLMGAQKIYHFHNKDQQITSLNTLMTPWKNNDNITEFIEKINEFIKKN